VRVRVGEMAQGRWAPPRISAVPFLLLLVSVLVPTTLLAQEGISLVGLTQLGPVETVAEFGQVEGGDGVAFSAVYDGRFIGDSSVAVADARRPVILVVDLPSGVAREIGR